jgi:hypothetical protein
MRGDQVANSIAISLLPQHRHRRNLTDQCTTGILPQPSTSDRQGQPQVFLLPVGSAEDDVEGAGEGIGLCGRLQLHQ